MGSTVWMWSMRFWTNGASRRKLRCPGGSIQGVTDSDGRALRMERKGGASGSNRESPAIYGNAGGLTRSRAGRSPFVLHPVVELVHAFFNPADYACDD